MPDENIDLRIRNTMNDNCKWLIFFIQMYLWWFNIKNGKKYSEAFLAYIK